MQDIFEAESKSEALTGISKLGAKKFEMFCDRLLTMEGYEITRSTKRGSDGGIDAVDETNDVAFHYTTRYDTNTKGKEDYDRDYSKNILLTNRPNRDSKDMDEVWDAEELARRVVN